MSIKRLLGGVLMTLALVSNEPALAGATLEAEGFDHYVLALTWQPGFCETTSRPLAECRDAEVQESAEQGFVLHGLWPSLPQRLADEGITPRRWRAEGCFLEQPRAGGSFCRAHAPFGFSEPLAGELDEAMPGRASCLDRYQYAKHAACLELPADDYFAMAVELLETVNASAFVDFVMIHRGGELDRNALIETFEAVFGQGTGRALNLKCAGRGNRVLTEVRIGIDARRLADFPAARSLVPLHRGRCAPRVRLVTTP
ncbi:ribonuclease I [Modicisalibacter ilicicola DSM 19980]|uniref:Ribonuclease I n=1 Tax=Modicisalibacter ilicicola DSM 19980 TaxID=1121942 RepID=A0A1M5B1U4_9GAMM|nr:ribonuclease I [Halomonas ilicicola]SHF36162.1 ribonuclease I [Halomonas ilicicola DSM 19980]